MSVRGTITSRTIVSPNSKTEWIICRSPDWITDEYDEDPDSVQQLSDGAYRVSSRLPIDELGELFGVPLDDDDVDTVGGLMAKLLGKVPIPGAEVGIEGLSLTAERPSGRRNQVGTVLVRRDEPTPAPQDQNHQHA